MSDDYIPYGDEWRKEIRRWNKERLIDGFRDANIARQEAEAEVKRLQEKLSGKVDGLTEMVRFNQESGQYDDTFNPMVKDDK